jgi:hypothetical protein
VQWVTPSSCMDKAKTFILRYILVWQLPLYPASHNSFPRKCSPNCVKLGQRECEADTHMGCVWDQQEMVIQAQGQERSGWALVPFKGV